MQKISAEIARELLRYEPDTGKLFWRARDRKWFETDKGWKIWSARFPGEEAFTAINGSGYRKGTILGRSYLIHRVIWLIQTGEWPEHQIDHVNHVKTDNRWCNLREVTNAQNGKNQSLFKNNTSGAVGVSWHKPAKKWRSQIKTCGNDYHIGYFENIEDAIAARKSAERELGFHKNHGQKITADASGTQT